MGRQWYGMKGLRTVDHRLLTVALVGGFTSTFRVSEPSSIGGWWLASEALACSRTKAPSPVDQGCFSRMVWGGKASCLEHVFVRPIVAREGPVGEWAEHDERSIDQWNGGW